VPGPTQAQNSTRRQVDAVELFAKRGRGPRLSGLSVTEERPCPDVIQALPAVDGIQLAIRACRESRVRALPVRRAGRRESTRGSA